MATPRGDAFIEAIHTLLAEMKLVPNKPKFYVDVNLDTKGKPSDVYSSATDTVFRLSIHPREWALLVIKPPKQSSARFYVDDDPFIASDAFGLFTSEPCATDAASLLRAAEKKLGVRFPRVAFVRTNLKGGKKAVAAWVSSIA